MSAFDAVVDTLSDEFAEAELPAGDGPSVTDVRLAGVGTIAAAAVRSPALHTAADAAGVTLHVGEAHATIPELLANPTWNLAVVLSPTKRDAVHVVDVCSPSAESSGVVDTIARTPAGTLGLNTNVYAAGAAITRCIIPARCDHVAILGTGASARSVAIACRRWIPTAEVVIVGRSPERATSTATELELTVGTGVGADIIINTTSWGETEESEASAPGIDLDPLLVPGAVVFDINNRVSALKRMALERGCAVVPGTLMQRLVNSLRITTARRLFRLG